MKKNRIVIEGAYTENIRSVARRMLELAKEGHIVNTVFNGTPLTTEGMNSVEDIIKQRDDYEKQRYEEYINSPQYEIDKEKRKKRDEEEEEKTKNLLHEFKMLDFGSIPAIVNWIGKMAECRNDLIANVTEVLPTLKANGYQSLKELLKNDCNKMSNISIESYIRLGANIEEIGHYLISQSMQSIQESGEIDGVMKYFAKLYELRLNNQIKDEDIDNKIRK